MPRPCLEVLRCPSMDGGPLAAMIRTRGNLPLAFGPDCVIELTPLDIEENWQSAVAMKREVAGAVAAELSHRLLRCAEEEEEAPSHAGEAAACLFLSLHHQGVALDEALKGCRVLWDTRHHSESIESI